MGRESRGPYARVAYRAEPALPAYAPDLAACSSRLGRQAAPGRSASAVGAPTGAPFRK